MPIAGNDTAGASNESREIILQTKRQYRPASSLPVMVKNLNDPMSAPD
jgi:hypothetical protein